MRNESISDFAKRRTALGKHKSKITYREEEMKRRTKNEK